VAPFLLRHPVHTYGRTDICTYGTARHYIPASPTGGWRDNKVRKQRTRHRLLQTTDDEARVDDGAHSTVLTTITRPLSIGSIAGDL